MRSASHSRLCAKDNGQGPALLRRGIVFAGGRARRSPSKRASSATRASGGIPSSDEASEPGFIRYPAGAGRTTGEGRRSGALARCQRRLVVRNVRDHALEGGQRELAHVRRLEQLPQGELDRERTIDLADELRGEQRMSAEIEEV